MKKSEKIRKNQKKFKKNRKKIINNNGIYDILEIFDQSWKKKEDRKVLYELLITQAKNVDKICSPNLINILKI